MEGIISARSGHGRQFTPLGCRWASLAVSMIHAQKTLGGFFERRRTLLLHIVGMNMRSCSANTSESSGFSSVLALQGFAVGQILRSGDGEFVLDQMFSGDHANRLIPVLRNHALGPSFIELNSVDQGQYIDAYGFDPDLKTTPGVVRSFP